MTTSNTGRPLELAILGLLAQRPRSGYDLLKIFAETALGCFTGSPGAIYPALKRLEGDGNIRGEVQHGDTLRPRQVFRLTGTGAATLRQYLRRPVTRDDVVRHTEGVLLRFAFAGEVLGRDEAVRILEEFAREIDAYLPDLEAQRAALPADAAPYGRHALQRGIEGYAADARWARAVIQELTRQDSAPAGRRGSRVRRRPGRAATGEQQA